MVFRESFKRQLCVRQRQTGPFQTGIMFEVILVSKFQTDLSTIAECQGATWCTCNVEFMKVFLAKPICLSAHSQATMSSSHSLTDTGHYSNRKVPCHSDTFQNIIYLIVYII